MSYLVAGTVLRRNVYINHGHYTYYPNLWMLFIAPSSFYRKSTTLSIARRLIYEFDKKLILPNEFTHEGLVRVMQDRSQGVMFHSEFLSFFGSIKKKYNEGLPGLFAELYDCPPEYERVLANEAITVKNPFVSIAAASTVEWLDSILKTQEVHGGFFQRFIPIPANKKEKIMPIPPDPDPKKREELLDTMNAMKLLNGKCVLSPEAQELYPKWYVDYENKNSMRPSLSGFYTRLQSTALKIACIFECFREYSLIVSKSNLEEACSVIEEITDKINEFMEEEVSSSKSDDQLNRVLKIAKRIGKRAPWSQVLKNSHLNAFEFLNVIKTLVEREQIKAVFPNGNTKGEIEVV